MDSFNDDMEERKEEEKKQTCNASCVPCNDTERKVPN
jgi:hypothetical protein